MRKLTCVLVLFLFLFSISTNVLAESGTTNFADALQELKTEIENDGMHFEFKVNDTCSYIEMSSAINMMYCEDYETWCEWRTTIVNMSQMFTAVMPFMEDCGDDLLMVLVAEENHDVIMLVLYNGEVVYDFFPSITYY